MRIWKYTIMIQDETIMIQDETILHMPGGAKILTVQMQNGVPYVWVLVNPDAMMARRTIRVFGTGHPIPSGYDDHHIGSVQDGALVWHVFDGGER